MTRNTVTPCNTLDALRGVTPKTPAGEAFALLCNTCNTCLRVGRGNRGSARGSARGHAHMCPRTRENGCYGCYTVTPALNSLVSKGFASCRGVTPSSSRLGLIAGERCGGRGCGGGGVLPRGRRHRGDGEHHTRPGGRRGADAARPRGRVDAHGRGGAVAAADDGRGRTMRERAYMRAMTGAREESVGMGDRARPVVGACAIAVCGGVRPRASGAPIRGSAAPRATTAPRVAPCGAGGDPGATAGWV